MKNLKSKLSSINPDTEAIILLHGFAGTSRSINKAVKMLSAYGYKTINIDYSSRKNSIETLAQDYTNFRVFNEFVNSAVQKNKMVDRPLF
ncbi:MAG: hypothetical protein LUO94_08365 [Methylococcaceae bacterium]|nr:hypothetical protein [Methylococcaceae bacterium]